MNPKKYNRLEPDGNHWPDADVGDDLFYGVDFNEYLANGSPLTPETIVSVNWTLPTELTSTDDFIQNDIGVIKLETSAIGVFKAVCTLTTVADAKEQTQSIPMLLTVY